ncbi:MAG TPA: thioredoxin-dependent thiol peroxidase [Anaerolineae bacterium]|nr:thioredoxin-dependent thiol peroxidase [Anaerolineae bacterium]
MLQPNTPAPGFTLPADDGRDVSLDDYRGQKVVLYFYPKDDTPGCTTEACGFRDDYSAILAAGAAVLGVSPDPVKSHVKFKVKFSLPFALLSDPDHRVAEMYGAWGKKKRYGREYDGILRTTYIIDERGTITHVFPNVKVSEHSQEVVAALRG